jgi:hypothetical protein
VLSLAVAQESLRNAVELSSFYEPPLPVSATQESNAVFADAFAQLVEVDQALVRESIAHLEAKAMAD